MQYNIHFQLFGLVLTTIMLILQIRKRAHKIYMQRAYANLYVAVFISLCFDILSVIMIVEEASFPLTLTKVVCKIYVMSVVYVGFSLWYYAFKEVRKGTNRIVPFWYGVIPYMIQLAIICIFPIHIYREGFIVYTYGVCVVTAYALSVGYMLITLLYLWIFRKTVNRHIAIAILCLAVSWISAGAYQFFNNEKLILGLAMGISMVYMYIQMENPDVYIDNESKAFNSFAYSHYLAKLKRQKKDFWLMAIRVEGLRFVDDNMEASQSRELLKQVSDFLVSFKGKPMSFRTGTAQFNVFFEDEGCMMDAIVAIRERFDSTWLVGNMPFNLNCKIAYLVDAQFTKTPNEIGDIFEYALNECTADKNVVRITDELFAERAEYIEAEKALNYALENDGVRVYYQPVYSVKNDKMQAMEALVRIVDEKGKLIMPNAFIPIAEKTGAILKLGSEVMKQVCDFMQTEKLEKLGVQYIEVNLSVIQCMQKDLAKEFIGIMYEKNIDPNKINFEITETAVIQSERILLQNMEKLMSEGTAFSLDDYGSGYSSLSYVLKFPVNIIKLDREMVWSYFTNPKSAIAMRHEVAMLHELGLEVVAEGVETRQQYIAMQDLGIDYIQGYYFSKPIPKEEVVPFLKNWNSEGKK